MCQFGPVKIPGGPEGGIVENSPPPFPHVRSALVSLFATKNFFSTNRMHKNDLKGCVNKCCCFRCHFEVKILTRFGIFCRFRSLYTYNGYNKFDWLTLILRSNCTCRIWFGILSSRAFCIVVSDFLYLLAFSNNCTLKHSKNIYWAFLRIKSVHNKALIRPREKICVVTVRRPTLILAPTLNIFMTRLVENY